MRIVIGTIGAIVALVWIEALVLPSRAWSPVPSLLPYELQGVMPVYSSNTVGTLGGLLAIWGLARPGGPGRAAFLNDVALVLGLATLVAAQYRTCAIGFLAVGALVAWRRRRSLFVTLAAAGALAALFVGAGAIRAQTETAFAKGNPDVIATLDSRTVYWQAAVPAIRERPLLGWGLNVGSRRVLVSLGEDSASTIHDTWVEAVLGTGVVGAALLAGAFLTGLRSAWLARRDATGVAVGAMLAFLVVRSITGSTAELFDVLFLVFVGLVFAAAQLGEAPRRQTRPLAASTTHGGYVPC
jgi:O-antigen ligase